MLEDLFKRFTDTRRMVIVNNPNNLSATNTRLNAYYEKNCSPEIMEVEKKEKESYCVVFNYGMRNNLIIGIASTCLTDYLTLLLHDDHIFTHIGVRTRFEKYLGKIAVQDRMLKQEFNCNINEIEAVLDCFYPRWKR